LFTTFNRLAIAGGVVVALTAAGAGTSQAEQNTAEKDKGKSASVKARRANQSLDEVAKLLASAVDEKSLRRQIRGEITERGTVDQAVTLKSLAASSDLDSELAEAYREEESTSAAKAEDAVDELTASLPPTQVSVPNKTDGWNAAAVEPLVGYVPKGIDDDDLKTITAYDSDGVAHELNAWVEPKRPVLILGPDETDYYDGLKATGKQGTGKQGTGKQAAHSPRTASRAAKAACYQVKLTHVQLWNDHEPWAKGMAETYMVAKAGGLYWEDRFPYLEMDGDQVWPDEVLGCATNNVRFYWWEDDSGSYDFSLKLGAFDFGVHMSDEDDLIGGRMREWSIFEGTSPNDTDFGDLVMTTH
jgi:hypothetical protein